jgi:hypothetical protein
MTVRTANAVWEGTLKEGNGVMSPKCWLALTFRWTRR